MVRQAQAKGLPITAEVCPHHFALDDRELAKGDSNYKMNPPLRSVEDVQAMKAAMGILAQNAVVSKAFLSASGPLAPKPRTMP